MMKSVKLSGGRMVRSQTHLSRRCGGNGSRSGRRRWSPDLRAFHVTTLREVKRRRTMCLDLCPLGTKRRLSDQRPAEHRLLKKKENEAKVQPASKTRKAERTRPIDFPAFCPSSCSLQDNKHKVTHFIFSLTLILFLKTNMRI